MISVIIPTLNSAADLPRCFESLISAVVRGVVRDVIVADGGSEDETHAMADATGAHFIRAGHGRAAQLAAGAKAARSDWLLFLNPETALEPGWDAEAETFMTHASLERPKAASFRFAREEFGRTSRGSEALARLRGLLFGLPRGGQALLMPKRLYQKLGGHHPSPAEDVDLLRRIGRRRLVTLRARGIHKTHREESEPRSVTYAVLSALRAPAAMLSRLS